METVFRDAAAFARLPNHARETTALLVPLCRHDNWRDVMWMLCEARHVTRVDGELLIGVDSSAHDITVLDSRGLPVSEERQALKMLADADLRVVDRLIEPPAESPFRDKPDLLFRCRQPDNRIVMPAEAPEVRAELAAFCETRLHFERLLTDKELADELTDGAMRLGSSANRKRHHAVADIPEYIFDVFLDDAPVGRVSLRIGYAPILYYFGHIGYWIYPHLRGRDLAGRACRVLQRVAARHEMPFLAIANDIKNLPSRRVCEKLGATYRRSILLPEESPLLGYGQRVGNLYYWREQD